MSTTSIGATIAALRKEHTKTQEERARAVSVSTQAVSKWENGGLPDTELLPKIADFFGVSVDALFGRNEIAPEGLSEAIAKTIADKKNAGEKLDEVFRLCWDMERALFIRFDGKETLDNIRKKSAGSRAYSCILDDAGITAMGLSETLPYFLVAPNPKDTEEAYFKGIDYPAFFAALSDAELFRALIFLYSRRAAKAFTPNLLATKLGISGEKTENILAFLNKYRLIHKNELEVDDETQTIYTFNPNPAITGLLIFAREMIDRPSRFYYYSGGRKKPYFGE